MIEPRRKKWGFKMRFLAIGAALFAFSTPATANDWEKFFTSAGDTAWLIPSATDPEVLPLGGDAEATLEGMWRRGFVSIGYSSFETNNDKTKDAVKLAKKLQARYVMIGTDLASSRTASIPITTPTTSTTMTNGHATAYGSGGMATGNYSGTSTTYGTSTSYIPITVNRYSKLAIFFKEVPRSGMGIMPRDLTPQEVGKLETRKAFAVRWVRDGSPAYQADILPGDIVTHIDGQPYEPSLAAAAVNSNKQFKLRIYRNGRFLDVPMAIPPEWRPAQQ